VNTTNCKMCETLVYETDIPTKRTGNCWRCEIERLRSEIARLEQELETCRIKSNER